MDFAFAKANFKPSHWERFFTTLHPYGGYRIAELLFSNLTFISVFFHFLKANKHNGMLKFKKGRLPYNMTIRDNHMVLPFMSYLYCLKKPCEMRVVVSQNNHISIGYFELKRLVVLT